MIGHTLEGEKALKKYGVPHVKVLQGQKDAWAIVEALERKDLTSFERFSKVFDSKDVNHQHLLSRLEAFSMQSMMFEDIADMHSKILVYSKSKDTWLVLDWSSGHIYWNENGMPHPSSHRISHPVGQYWFKNAELNEAIEKIATKWSKARRSLFEAKMKSRLQGCSSLFLNHLFGNHELSE